MDAHFWNPEFIELEKKIQSVSNDSLGMIVNFSNETWSPNADFFNSEYFPYLEISAVGLGTNEYYLVDVKVDNTPSRARMVLRSNDIVISTTRPHRGAIAKIKDEDSLCIGSTGFAVLRELLDNTFNELFLLNSLQTKITLTQFLRRSSGGTYPAITLDELKQVKIPKPPIEKQKELVDAIEQARESRRCKLAEAESLLQSLDGWILEQLNIEPPPNDERKLYAVKLQDLRNSSRLNADYFHPERLLSIRNIEEQESRMKVEPLNLIVDFIRDTRKTPDNRYIGLANIEAHTGEFLNIEENVSGSCLAFEEDDVLFGRLRPYLNKVYRATFDGVCSPEFHVMRIKNRDALNPSYLSTILRSSIILAQTKHMMTGNTHPRLTNDDVINLVIPVPEIKVQETIAEELIIRREQAQQLRREAETEWQAAKDWFEAQLLGD